MSRAIIMSKKEFRPRPIDINQPIPIISDEKILEEIERENYSIASPIKPRLKTPKNKLSAVDTPLYRELSEKSSIRFARPQNYIIYNEEDSDGTLSAGEQEYELDHADELFLAALNTNIKQRPHSNHSNHSTHSNHSNHSNHNHSNHSAPSPRESSRQLRTRSTPPTPVKGRKDKSAIPVCLAVTDDMLEQLIDGLEKEAFFSYGLRQMKDNTMDGILCCVCNDHQGDAADPLILCDGCNMATHQHCYGISEVPVATWLCARCVKRESNSMCVLCGGRYGGMKATADGHWVHVLCALWFPEVSCKDSFLRDPISGIDKIHSDRWHKVCSLCNDTRGVCITCDEPGCKTQFHVGCARAQGSYLEARPDNQNENNVVLKAYCSLHSLHHLEHYPVFPRDVERSLGNETALVAKSMGLSEEDYNIIYSYWRVKRRSHPPPLLKRLRSSDLRVRPPSQLTPSEALARFVRLRQDFERARMLVDLVRKRELAKRQLLDSLHSLVLYHTGGEEDDQQEQEEQEEPSKEKRETHTPKRVRR